MSVRCCLVFGAVVLGLGAGVVEACTQQRTTVVEEIYPSGNVLPENTLRLYLYFSGPMADEDIISKISLRQKNGRLIEGAFLNNRFDLWSPDRRRLTLLFDPGRVKTGLAAHEALGRALIDGEDYVLALGSGALDAFGCFLAEEFTHGFVAGPSDIETPDPTNWGLNVPKVGSTKPLRVSLGRAHDHLSMAFKIRVKLDGEPLAGRVALEEHESVWVFTPQAPWRALTYEISVEAEFEDLAGNRPGELFDKPIGTDAPSPELSIWFDPADG